MFKILTLALLLFSSLACTVQATQLDACEKACSSTGMQSCTYEACVCLPKGAR